jgi:hypothetical protein
MSHIVTIQTKVRDPAALAAACARLGLAAPVQGTARLFGGAVSGLLVKLPGWQYPVVVDPQTGEDRFDNFGGSWGDQKELDRLLQMYAVEKCRIEARRRGHTLTEQQLADGSIRLQITERG